MFPNPRYSEHTDSKGGLPHAQACAAALTSRFSLAGPSLLSSQSIFLPKFAGRGSPALRDLRVSETRPPPLPKIAFPTSMAGDLLRIGRDTCLHMIVCHLQENVIILLAGMHIYRNVIVCYLPEHVCMRTCRNA